MNYPEHIDLKVAIVHEWFLTLGGSEKVVQALTEVFPQADLFALFSDAAFVNSLGLGDKEITTSFLNRLPFSRKVYQKLLPFFPFAVEQFDLRGYDIVISSSHAVAKGVLTHAQQTHIAYIHTPMRYAWDLYHEYTSGRGIFNFIAKLFLHRLRMWDVLTASRPDVLLSNSDFVGRRIAKIYSRQATTVYPPVDVDAFPLCDKKDDYYFTLSRLVAYKKVDVILESFRKMPHKRLIIAGDGPYLNQMKRIAPKNVQLLGFVSQKEAIGYMQHAKAFIFAALEDFGISPVEAQACGTPVIAFGKGGAKETVEEGITGHFFYKQTPEAIAKAVHEFDNMSFDYAEIAQHAQKFSKKRFVDQIIAVVDANFERKYSENK